METPAMILFEGHSHLIIDAPTFGGIVRLGKTGWG